MCEKYKELKDLTNSKANHQSHLKCSLLDPDTCTKSIYGGSNARPVYQKTRESFEERSGQSSFPKSKMLQIYNDQ